MKIEVGEYVRDREGNISKIGNVINENLYIGDDGNSYSQNCIVKHSKNIIDLIETGDYVNGDRVIGVSNISGWVDTTKDVIYKKHIKSIVTHEQFNQVKYEV